MHMAIKFLHAAEGRPARFNAQILFQVGITCVLLIVFAGATAYVRGDIKNRAERIDIARAELSLRQDAVGAYVLLKDASVRAEPYIQVLHTVLPTKEELINFPKVMRSLGEANAIDITVTFGRDSSGGVEGELMNTAFGISAEGSLVNLIRFLESVEQSVYFVAFTSLKLTALGQGYRISLDGRVYSRV